MLYACLAPATGAPLDEPPPGLIRTSTTLAKVRALYERMHPPQRLRSGEVIEEWRLAQDRMVGTYRVWRLGGDIREDTMTGPLEFESGRRGDVAWQQNRNGLTFTYGGFHDRRDEISERAWETPTETRDVRLIGESVALNAYVVEVDPPGGRHEWLYIDKSGGNVIRRELVEKHRRVVTTYDDFRLFDGVPEPSHVRTTDSLGNERELTLLARTLDLIPDPKDLDIPASRRQLVEFPSATTFARLPVRVVDGLLVVTVTIGLRSYDFLLDSGAAGLVVDPSVIADAKLERYGMHFGSTLGTFAESTSIVPQMQIGALRMRNVVVRVVSVPFVVDGTHIAGLLGFDFFADAVVHVDVERGIVNAIAPGTFHPPADAVAAPLALDDKTPDVRARIAGTIGRIVVDTGANRSVFTSDFALRASFGAGDPGSVTLFRAMGGTGAAETVHVKDFELAGFEQADPEVDVSSADFDAEDIDGTAGTDLLRPYDLYFDYRAQTLYVRRATVASVHRPTHAS